MRILFDARRSVHRANGISRIIDGLLGALVELDQQNEYLILWGEKNPLPANAPSNFEARYIDLGINSLAINWLMPQIARAWNADIAYFPFWLMPIAMPCPSVVGVHDVMFSAYPHELSLTRRLFYNVYMRWILRAARRIQTISVFSQQELERWFQISPGRVDVIWIDTTINFSSGCPIRADIDESSGLSKPFALYVGNHKPHKNLERLLNAYASVAGNLEVNLAIVGARAKYEDPLALPYLTLVKELGLEHRVYFFCQIEDDKLSALYATARFFVFPSLYEGFGLPPLEAMRCGTPVMCSNNTSLPEVVGDAALTFDPQDVQQIAQALVRLDGSQNLRAELSKRGLEQAKLFSWHKAADNWLASMERAAGQMRSESDA